MRTAADCVRGPCCPAGCSLICGARTSIWTAGVPVCRTAYEHKIRLLRTGRGDDFDFIYARFYSDL